MKKSIKKVFCLVLSLTALLSSMGALGFSTALAAAIDGVTGEGTNTSPYQIGTPEQFIAVVAKMTYADTNYAELTDDIDLSDTSYIPGRFAGHLDGKGHSITFQVTKTSDSGMYGLFTGLRNNVEIKNLTLKGSVSSTNVYAYSSGSGALAGYTFGDKGNITLSNITNYASVTSASDDTGGIIGKVSKVAEGYTYTFENLVNYGVISAPSSTNGTGGIVGNLGRDVADGTYKFSKCFNYGSVSGSRYVGGIIGNVTNASASIKNCGNYGAISGALATETYSAGIIGRLQKMTSEPIEGCFNAGKITSKRWGAGIATSSIKDSVQSYKDCFNIGTIAVEERYATGLVMHSTSGGDTQDASFENCYNAGLLITKDSQWAGWGNYPITEKNANHNVDTMKNCHYVDTPLNIMNGGENFGVTKKTPTEMKEVALGEAWEVDSANGFYYPQLKNNKLDPKDANGKVISINELLGLAPAPESIDFGSSNYAVQATAPDNLTVNGVDITTGYFVAFAKAPDVAGYNVSYGVTMGTEAENGNIFKALRKYSDGGYGVLFWGDGLKLGTTYYVTPYAVYENYITGQTQNCTGAQIAINYSAE